MSWNCNNGCHVITTKMARQIIAAQTALTLPFVEFTDLDGSTFHVTTSDAPCLKIVIDLKDGGGRVLQDIGILLGDLAFVRNTVYDSDALRQVRCNALCPIPFSVQLSSDIELIVCEACNPCCCPPDNSARFLMLMAFFLGLLLLLYFLSLLCYFWRQWSCNPCSICSQPSHNMTCPIGTPVILTNPVAPPPSPQSLVGVPAALQPIEEPLILVVPSDLPATKGEVPLAAIVSSALQPIEPPIVVISSDLSIGKVEESVVAEAFPAVEPSVLSSDLTVGKIEASPVVVSSTVQTRAPLSVEPSDLQATVTPAVS
jgi:hypothetical protein